MALLFKPSASWVMSINRINAFYAAMKEWGKYTLVFSPAEADLVFEIRFNAPSNGDEHVPNNVPQLHLTIYDPKTALWFGLCSLRSKELFAGILSLETFRNFESRDRLGAGRPEKLAGHRG
jgi:hypothetical protein